MNLQSKLLNFNWETSCFSTLSVTSSIRLDTDEFLKGKDSVISGEFWFITVEITTDTAESTKNSPIIYGLPSFAISFDFL